MSKIKEKQSAGGIVYSDGQILTIRAIPQNEIVFPKGTIETGESPEQTAVREVFEETGYKVKVKAPLGSVTYEFDEEDGEHYRKTVFHYLLELEDPSVIPTPNRLDGEDLENLWLTLEDAFNHLTHDDSRNTLKKALTILEVNQ